MTANTVRVRMLNPRTAAERLAGLAELDPRGLTTEADILPMCEAGLCVEVADDSGAAVVVVRLGNPAGIAWIDAAGGGGGRDLCQAIDDAVSELPINAVAFQTARPGLVRRAKRNGYRVTGYILRRDL